MRRPQFSLKALLWLMALVAAFMGGMVAQAQLDRPQITRYQDCGCSPVFDEILTTRDGKQWVRRRIVIMDEDEALLGIPTTP